MRRTVPGAPPGMPRSPEARLPGSGARASGRRRRDAGNFAADRNPPAERPAATRFPAIASSARARIPPRSIASSDPGRATTANSNHGGHPGNGTSCLGITVKYTNYCFKGAEEHGLEVTSIDRNSPAERAGLKADRRPGRSDRGGRNRERISRPMQLLTNGFLEKAAQGNRGDLIVAVDDQRVRSQADFDDAMARARPGDSLYLTVIRPLPGGDHKTMKIAVDGRASGSPATPNPAPRRPPPRAGNPASPNSRSARSHFSESKLCYNPSLRHADACEQLFRASRQAVLRSFARKLGAIKLRPE